MERQQARMPVTLGIHLGCVGQPPILLQVTSTYPFSPSYSGSEDVLQVKRLRECRKLPRIKEQERQVLKFKKQ